MPPSATAGQILFEKLDRLSTPRKPISVPTPMDIDLCQGDGHKCGKYGHTAKECRSSSRGGAEKPQCAQRGKKHHGQCWTRRYTSSHKDSQEGGWKGHRKGNGKGTQNSVAILVQEPFPVRTCTVFFSFTSASGFAMSKCLQPHFLFAACASVFMATDRACEDAMHTSLPGSPQLSSNVGSPKGSGHDLDGKASRSTDERLREIRESLLPLVPLARSVANFENHIQTTTNSVVLLTSTITNIEQIVNTFSTKTASFAEMKQNYSALSSTEDEQPRSAVLFRFPCEQNLKGITKWIDTLWEKSNMLGCNKPVRCHCKAGSVSVRLVFETRATCQDFLARYKDDGIPFSINSPFCCTNTTITVGQWRTER